MQSNEVRQLFIRVDVEVSDSPAVDVSVQFEYPSFDMGIFDYESAQLRCRFSLVEQERSTWRKRQAAARKQLIYDSVRCEQSCA